MSMSITTGYEETQARKLRHAAALGRHDALMMSNAVKAIACDAAAYTLKGEPRMTQDEHQMMMSKQAAAREAPVFPTTHEIAKARRDAAMAAFTAMEERDLAAARANPMMAQCRAYENEGLMQETAMERPKHYTMFAIEPMTFAMVNDLPAWTMNVIKYICRAPYKHDDEAIDIRKAIRFCEMRLEELKRRKDGTIGNVLNRPL